MSPRAVDKRARPGNEQHATRPPAPEHPSPVVALQTTNPISAKKQQQAKAS
ncbi:hypothetical protein [Kribbella sp. NPDC048915]|uniref:hypothetical protein n=1 Tax=Kribbella sp. NPDC048915 TaxID=3155148 RepID=UPI00340851D8